MLYRGDAQTAAETVLREVLTSLRDLLISDMAQYEGTDPVKLIEFVSRAKVLDGAIRGTTYKISEIRAAIQREQKKTVGKKI